MVQYARDKHFSRPADSRSDTLTADARRLRALSRELQQASGSKREKAQAGLAALLAASRTAVAERRSKLPRPEFQPDLPVNERRADIAELIANHQVVIVCGETGSGKTTQLPKICLDLGIGARGLIGHTQPRRLAARSVATRLAQELKTQVGAGVGVKIRFHDKSTADSWVKLMTDGILLAESQSDPYLNAYEAIIIDEAHERSLNIDFLLGYLKQLLPKRPDLKLIITSATIDAERFSQHFNGAPVIEVSGRLYPVDVRYRPVVDIDKKDDERDLYDAIVDAADEVARLGSGDILVFLPGEREIREAAEALRKHALARPGLSSAHAPEILPLFSRLSSGEQDRIFKPSGSQRRIVLATNVAETSLTVPGIRYVIDTGLARVKRYSYRNKVEQLQVERISQAAARQRAGRCGRVAAGVCVRLYDEADFTARATVHRSGNPPFVAGRRHPAHEVAAPDRCRDLPVHRAAAGQGDQRRLRAAAGAGRAGRRQQTDQGWRSAGQTAARSAHRPHAGRGARPRLPEAKSWSSPPACRYRIRANGRRSASRRLMKSTSCGPTRSRNS